MNHWRTSTFFLAAVVIVLALGLGITVPTLVATKRQATCDAVHRNQALIRSILDAFGGPQTIVEPRTRHEVVRLLRPIDC